MMKIGEALDGPYSNFKSVLPFKEAKLFSATASAAAAAIREQLLV